MLQKLHSLIERVTSKWQEATQTQKIAGLSLLGLLFAGMTFISFNSTPKAYESLITHDHPLAIDADAIKTYLKKQRVPFQVQNGDISVPADKINEIRHALNTVSAPKAENNKGFALFDSNTWMKGEKELQILEMRALKGQIEHDLELFDHVVSATVSLDIPPQRPLASTQPQTKASIILKLKKGTTLSASQLNAITSHVSAAVRGLNPNMIAISDTSGTIYQDMDPDETRFTQKQSTVIAEEKLKNNISTMLDLMIGKGHYHTAVSIISRPNQQDLIAVNILIDQNVIHPGSLDEPHAPTTLLKQAIQRQIHFLLLGNQAQQRIEIAAVPFEQKAEAINREIAASNPSSSTLISKLLVLGGLLTLGGGIVWKRYSNTVKEQLSDTHHLMDDEVIKMIDSIRQQIDKDPSPIIKFIRK